VSKLADLADNPGVSAGLISKEGQGNLYEGWPHLGVSTPFGNVAQESENPP
jgi:hypothetical protein